MKLHCFYTPNNKILKDKFESTICDDYEIICHPVDFDLMAGSLGGGLKIWLFKLNDIINVIKENWSQTILYSDIDIQFFKPIRTIVEDAIRDKDLVFQREGGLKCVNIGFMAIRCNDKTLSFFKKILKIVEETRQWDQKVISDQIKQEGTLSWGFFPHEIWSWSQGGHWGNVALHHATGVNLPAEKLKQMAFVSWTRKFHMIGFSIFILKVYTLIFHRRSALIFKRHPLERLT